MIRVVIRDLHQLGHCFTFDLGGDCLVGDWKKLLYSPKLCHETDHLSVTNHGSVFLGGNTLGNSEALLFLPTSDYPQEE